MSPKYEPKQNDIAGYIEALTQSEARQLNLYKGPESLRAAILEERQKAGLGKGKMLLREEILTEEVTIIKPTPLWISQGVSLSFFSLLTG